ncbi:hypothetical protein MRX96_018547 [Rhipicephalus microplus]
MSTMSEPQELKEENGEVIDLSCRVCGIEQFEHIGYLMEHLESEAHRERRVRSLDSGSLLLMPKTLKFSIELLEV